MRDPRQRPIEVLVDDQWTRRAFEQLEPGQIFRVVDEPGLINPWSGVVHTCLEAPRLDDQGVYGCRVATYDGEG